LTKNRELPKYNAHDNPNIIALVPMRHNSHRVKCKNYKQFAGRMLYQHIIESLMNCKYISQVVIDTDSPIIKKDTLMNFPDVKLIDRPENLRGEKISMNQILLYDIKNFKGDFYIQTHSTNPLLNTETITRAIETFIEKYPDNDSLFTVSKIRTRLWDKNGKAINHDPSILLRTQDLPPIYEENSCIYIFTAEKLKSRCNRIGENPIMFEIDRSEAWDIDEELDFKIAEFLYYQTRK